MKYECPYCGGALKKPPQITLPKRLRRLYDYISSYGDRGVEARGIWEALYRGKSHTTVRTAIHALNKELKDSVVKGRGGVYRLTKR